VAIKWREIRTGKRTHPVISGNNNRKNKIGLSSVFRGLRWYRADSVVTDRIVDIVVMMRPRGLFSLRERAISDGI